MGGLISLSIDTEKNSEWVDKSENSLRKFINLYDIIFLINSLNNFLCHSQHKSG
jgi:hypothetical protein